MPGLGWKFASLVRVSGIELFGVDYCCEKIVGVRVSGTWDWRNAERGREW